MQTYSTIGEIIKFYRAKANLSQAELSLGICDRKYLSKIERNLCVPTLDIINQLSERLEINLYDNYALILRHHDIETHEKMTQLNQFFFSGQENLKPLIEEFQKLDSFKSGEPFQFLKYAESLYASAVLLDYNLAISKCLEGLFFQNHKKLFSQDKPLTNIETNLLLALGVNYCRTNNLNAGREILLHLLEYIKKILSKDKYIVNRNFRYEQNVLSITTLNFFVVFKHHLSYDLLLCQIDETLDILQLHRNSTFVPDLLLCKAYSQYNLDEVDKAFSTYDIAHHFCMYYYKDNYQSIEEEFLKELYPVFSNK